MELAHASSPREVLVIGNGFDIALDLPTKYIDFLDFLRINDPIEIIERAKSGECFEEGYEKYLKTIDSINISEIQRLKKIQEENSWAYYFLNCNAEIAGWIDLEKEMVPVLNFFKWLFLQKIKIINKASNKALAQIDDIDEDKFRLAKILPKFVSWGSSPSSSYALRVLDKYCDKQYGIFKTKMLDVLKEDLEKFIEMFRIYLRELVLNAERKKCPAIEGLHADQIINFNYVQSEIWFPNLKDATIIHVHGDTLQKGKMVLGINEIEDDLKKDFLFFTKSFQRIKNACDPNYRDFWNGRFNATFFGHSLDATDIGIIKPLYENALHVTIYYYSQDDYEKKIINLIKMVDTIQIENDIYNHRLELIPST